MNGREIIRDIMAKNEITNKLLANRLKISTAALWDRIDTQPRKGKPGKPGKPRKDIPVSLLSEMVQAMDYKVVVVPVSTKIPKEGYTIGASKTNSETSISKSESQKQPKNIDPVIPGHRIKLM